jgi:hypothetical protein
MVDLILGKHGIVFNTGRVDNGRQLVYGGLDDQFGNIDVFDGEFTTSTLLTTIALFSFSGILAVFALLVNRYIMYVIGVIESSTFLKYQKKKKS